MGKLIGILIAVLVLLGGPIFTGMKRAYAFVSTRLPHVPSPKGILTASVTIPIWKVLALIAAFALISGGGGISLPDWKLPGLPSLLVSHADQATYVYEKDNTSVPNEVESALNKLNRERNILASIFEQDTLDGEGKIPAQYVVALDAAKKNGLPSLVATAKGRVLKVIKDPRTEADVIGGVP